MIDKQGRPRKHLSQRGETVACGRKLLWVESDGSRHRIASSIPDVRSHWAPVDSHVTLLDKGETFILLPGCVKPQILRDLRPASGPVRDDTH